MGWLYDLVVAPVGAWLLGHPVLLLGGLCALPPLAVAVVLFVVPLDRGRELPFIPRARKP